MPPFIASLFASVLFYVALVSVFFFIAYGVAEATLKLTRHNHAFWTQAASKRLAFPALLLPPLLAFVPTVAGTLFRPAAHTPFVHHAAACKLLFSRLSQFLGADASGAPGYGIRFFLGGAACFLLTWGFVRASRRLQMLWYLRGIAAHLTPPSPRLVASLARVKKRLSYLPTHRFYESAIPAAVSSVIGINPARCVLSADLVARLPDGELNALVAHEAHHLHYDTRAAFLVGILSDVFFFLRPVSLLVRHWHEAAERACDDTAAGVTGDSLIVASALLRVSGAPIPLQAALPFAEPGGVPRRVERLLHHAQTAHTPPNETPWQARVGWLSAIVFALIGAGLLVSSEAACVAECSMELGRRIL